MFLQPIGPTDAESLLFQRPPSSFDLGATSPDTGDFGPDTRNLAESGLPLTKSDAPYFPPPVQTPFAPTLSDLLQPPTVQGTAGSVAHWVAPFTYDYLTYQPPPVFAANSAGKLASAPDAFGIGVDALSLFGPGGAAAHAADAAESVLGRVGLESLFGVNRPAVDTASQLARGAVDAGVLSETYPQLITGRFADLEGKLLPGWQRHHVNQDGVFGEIVPYDDAFTVGMRGNILTEPGTPHYKFHRSMEDFWGQFRREGARLGDLPTIAEYHRAVQQAFVVAGFTPGEASYLVKQAANDLTSRGVSLSAKVPKIPRAIWRGSNY